MTMATAFRHIAPTIAAHHLDIVKILILSTQAKGIVQHTTNGEIAVPQLLMVELLQDM